MDNKEVIEGGNILIADFMKYPNGKLFHGSFHPKHYMPFDKSWDALMPVVEKIEGLFIDQRPVIVSISGSGAVIYLNKYKAIGGYGEQPDKEISNTLNCNYFHDTPDDADRLTKIEAVWLSVVNFIKFYNQNLNK